MSNQANYKINLHAHTIFSDGKNTPLGMALEAKKIGLSALVITDHFNSKPNGNDHGALNASKFRLLKAACVEAKKIMPVIVGIELYFGGEEILVFGSETIYAIMKYTENSALTLDWLISIREIYQSAFILCHPMAQENWDNLTPIIDGYEEYNSCEHMFSYVDCGKTIDIEKGGLEGFPMWCNSDAHNFESLNTAYNLVDTKIKNEVDLIKYVKRKKQPKFVIKGNQI